jgi:hypothetical protein
VTAGKSQRLVLGIGPSRRIKIADFLLFMEELKKHSLSPSEDVSVEITAEGEIKFAVLLPPLIPPQKTPQKKAADKQIAAHKAALQSGEEVPGYVPPAKPRRVIRVLPSWKLGQVKRK